MAPRKSKKLEKLGVSKVVLHVNADATNNNDYVAMRFEFGEFSLANVTLQWMRSRLDYDVGGFPRDIDYRAGELLSLRKQLENIEVRKCLDVGRAAYGVPFACRVDDAKVDGVTSIERLTGILAWIRGIDAQGSFVSTVEAVQAESVGLETRYRYNDSANKWETWLDWEDAGWGKTWQFISSAQSEQLIADYHAARAKRLAANEQKEVA